MVVIDFTFLLKLRLELSIEWTIEEFFGKEKAKR